MNNLTMTKTSQNCKICIIHKTQKISKFNDGFSYFFVDFYRWPGRIVIHLKCKKKNHLLCNLFDMVYSFYTILLLLHYVIEVLQRNWAVYADMFKINTLNGHLQYCLYINSFNMQFKFPLIIYKNKKNPSQSNFFFSNPHTKNHFNLTVFDVSFQMNIIHCEFHDTQYSKSVVICT